MTREKAIADRERVYIYMIISSTELLFRPLSSHCHYLTTFWFLFFHHVMHTGIPPPAVLKYITSRSFSIDQSLRLKKNSALFIHIEASIIIVCLIYLYIYVTGKRRFLSPRHDACKHMAMRTASSFFPGSEMQHATMHGH